MEDIGDYISFQLNNAKAAVSLLKSLHQTVKTLAMHPGRHELDDDEILAELGVRRIYHKEYKIYYMVYELQHSVVVLRILHMRVDSQAKLYRVFGL